jgi:hypothetical protein
VTCLNLIKISVGHDFRANCIAPLVVNLARVVMVSFKSRPPYLLGRVDGTKWIGDRVEPRTNTEAVESINTCLCREYNPDRPARSLVTIHTELSLLLILMGYFQKKNIL